MTLTIKEAAREERRKTKSRPPKPKKAVTVDFGPGTAGELISASIDNTIDFAALKAQSATTEDISMVVPHHVLKGTYEITGIVPTGGNLLVFQNSFPLMEGTDYEFINGGMTILFNTELCAGDVLLFRAAI